MNGLCDWLLWPAVYSRNDIVLFSEPILYESNSFHLLSFGTLVLEEITLHRRNLTILTPPHWKVTQNRHLESLYEEKNTYSISHSSSKGCFHARYVNEEAFRCPQHLATTWIEQCKTSKTLPKFPDLQNHEEIN